MEDIFEEYLDVKKEVEKIEVIFMNFFYDKSFIILDFVWEGVLNFIKGVCKLNVFKKIIRLFMMIGWVVVIVFLLGIFWMLKENNILEN